jgi:hypothetical protein
MHVYLHLQGITAGLPVARSLKQLRRFQTEDPLRYFFNRARHWRSPLSQNPPTPCTSSCKPDAEIPRSSHWPAVSHLIQSHQQVPHSLVPVCPSLFISSGAGSKKIAPGRLFPSYLCCPVPDGHYRLRCRFSGLWAISSHSLPLGRGRKDFVDIPSRRGSSVSPCPVQYRYNTPGPLLQLNSLVSTSGPMKQLPFETFVQSICLLDLKGKGKAAVKLAPDSKT